MRLLLSVFSVNYPTPWAPTTFSCSARIEPKDIKVLERAYADSQGLTAEFILNVFVPYQQSGGQQF